MDDDASSSDDDMIARFLGGEDLKSAPEKKGKKKASPGSAKRRSKAKKPKAKKAKKAKAAPRSDGEEEPEEPESELEADDEADSDAEQESGSESEEEPADSDDDVFGASSKKKAKPWKKKAAAKPRRAKKPKREGPKRGKSAYMFFCDAQRDVVKAEQPELKATQVMQELGRRWQAVHILKKKEHEAQAAQDKARYQEELAAFKLVQKQKKEEEKRARREAGLPSEDEEEEPTPKPKKARKPNGSAKKKKKKAKREKVDPGSSDSEGGGEIDQAEIDELIASAPGNGKDSDDDFDAAEGADELLQDMQDENSSSSSDSDAAPGNGRKGRGKSRLDRRRQSGSPAPKPKVPKAPIDELAQHDPLVDPHAAIDSEHVHGVLARCEDSPEGADEFYNVMLRKQDEALDLELLEQRPSMQQEEKAGDSDAGEESSAMATEEPAARPLTAQQKDPLAMRPGSEFFLMQIIRFSRNGAPKFCLLTRFGRVGHFGKATCKEFAKLNTASKAFREYYLCLTQNDFDLRHHMTFKAKPGQWTQSEIDHASNSADMLKMDAVTVAELLKATHEGDELRQGENECELPSSLQFMLEKAFSADSVHRSLLAMGLQIDVLPPSKLTASRVLSAMQHLKNIDEILSSGLARSEWPMDALTENSQAFFAQLPFDIGDAEISDALTDSEELARKQAHCRSLLDIVTMIEMTRCGRLAGAKQSKLERDYDLLGSTLTHLETSEFGAPGWITKMVENDKFLQEQAMAIKGMYQVERLCETFALSSGDEYSTAFAAKLPKGRQMLWRGIPLTGAASTLRHGLKTPREQESDAGYSHGKGLYFTDVPNATAENCMATADQPFGVLLLCECALGEQLPLDSKRQRLGLLPKGCHSMLGSGRIYPNPEDAVDMEGCSWPLGELLTPEETAGKAVHNEYMLQDQSQVQVKYMVLVEFEFDEEAKSSALAKRSERDASARERRAGKLQGLAEAAQERQAAAEAKKRPAAEEPVDPAAAVATAEENAEAEGQRRADALEAEADAEATAEAESEQRSAEQGQTEQSPTEAQEAQPMESESGATGSETATAASEPAVLRTNSTLENSTLEFEEGEESAPAEAEAEAEAEPEPAQNEEPAAEPEPENRETETMPESAMEAEPSVATETRTETQEETETPLAETVPMEQTQEFTQDGHDANAGN